MPRKCIDNPVAVPEVEADLPDAITAIFDFFASKAKALVRRLGLPTDAASFANLERALFRLVVKIADQIVAAVLILATATPKVAEAVPRVRMTAAAARGHALRAHGNVDVAVTLLGGSSVRLSTPYLAPDYSNRPGPRRTRRRKSGSGCYPVLDHLGFIERYSPATASTVAREACALSSFAEARRSLETRGLDLNVKTVRRLAELFGERALRARDALLESFEGDRPPPGDEFGGRRVALAIDGGRTRTRIPRRRGRRRRKTRRRGYDTPWREPKQLAIYECDDHGRKTNRRPVYQGTFECWDDAFRIFAAECWRRGVSRAEKVFVIGDGSNNIWDRADRLVAALELDPDRVTKVVDFYHASEHLHDLVKLCKSWSKKRRDRWLRDATDHLKKGAIDDLLEAAEPLKVGRRAPQIDKALDYFRERKDRMRYGFFKAAGIPRGSGVIESAFRRVVNQRLKGPGIFWEVDNAERILILRANLKAGRWEELERDVASPAACAGLRRLLPRERTRAAA